MYVDLSQDLDWRKRRILDLPSLSLSRTQKERAIILKTIALPLYDKGENYELIDV